MPALADAGIVQNIVEYAPVVIQLSTHADATDAAADR
jgi:hypothetical protein